MTAHELARLLDHSVLKPDATEADVLDGTAVVRKWGIRYYCVQPTWVRAVASALADTDSQVVAVIGFPHGCERSPTKAGAAGLAVDEGARELDMVINVGALKGGDTALVEADIAAVVQAAGGNPVKVILETCLLTEIEKRLACRIVRAAGAAFVKTSTGFHPLGGATAADIRLMREEVGPTFGVKASGGIRSLADSRTMIDAGANRIGTSASAMILGALGAGPL
jgi:deoxyribose-phosphate aldolase